MKFTEQRKAYHTQVLREVARMITGQPNTREKVVTVIPTKETHTWAAGKVRSLLKT